MTNNSFRDKFIKRGQILFRLCSITLMSAIFFFNFSKSCSAAVYECKTEQVIMWKDGLLIRQNEQTFGGAHSIIRFNDQTGEFRIAINQDSVFSLIPFRIIKDDKEELLAVYKNDDENLGGSSFYIRKWNEKAGLTFMLNMISDKTFSGGKCQIRSNSTE